MKAKKTFRRIVGSITAPKGFKAAAVFCDIKRLGTGKGSQKGQKRDLALIVSDTPAAVAGMFTTNDFRAAPVRLCVKCVANGEARAIVANSGNANACTGKQGAADAESMSRIAAEALALHPRDLLVCSTGRIGSLLPMENVARGISAVAERLRSDRASAAHVAEAIMTSDTRPKKVAVEFELDGKPVRIGGVCKGAGMIQPGMTPTGARELHATMLCFITSDAAIDSKLLKHSLRASVAQSFNRITIDGDMSTNDTVLVLANGAAGNKRITSSRGQGYATFQIALDYVTNQLARMIVLDGEGVSRFVTVHIHGAATAHDAEITARAIANSSLVKTSWCGGDPNWGRVLSAVGMSGARVHESKVEVGYSSAGGTTVTYASRKGEPTNVAFATLAKIVSRAAFDIHVFLHLGKHAFSLYAADLTERYVEFNKGDVSDPNALGG